MCVGGCDSLKSFYFFTVLFTLLFTLLYTFFFTLYTFGLSEAKLEDCLDLIAAKQFDGAVVIAHYLSGDTQTNSGAFFLSGVERDENLLLRRGRDGLAVVGNAYDDIVLFAHAGCDVYMLRTGLKGVLDEIDDYLGYLPLIGVDDQVGILRPICAFGAAGGHQFAVQGNYAAHQILKFKRLA